MYRMFVLDTVNVASENVCNYLKSKLISHSLPTV